MRLYNTNITKFFKYPKIPFNKNITILLKVSANDL